MESELIIELRELIDDVIDARTKKDAQMPIKRLRFKASRLHGQIDPYLYGKLGEVISHAESAAGQVRDKDHWISCLDSSWYVFESRMKNQNETE